MRILNAHATHLNAADSPGGVAQQHDVARQALDRKVLINAADNDAFRLRYHRVIRGVRYRSPGSDCSQARSTASSNAAVDAIVMQIGLPPAAPRRDTFGQHPKDGIEVFALEVAVGICALDHLEQVTFLPLLSRCRSDK